MAQVKILYENEVGQYNEIFVKTGEYGLMTSFVGVTLEGKTRLIPNNRIFYIDVFEEED